MKNTRKLLGLIALAAVVTLSMTALSLTGCFMLDDDGTVVSIEITKQPTKTAYNLGDKLDTTGMIVTATYADGTTKIVNDYTTYGFDSLSAGTKIVTVAYEGKIANFTVTVSGTTPPPVKTVSSITITTPPTKTTYNVGEDLALTGLVVTATYSDNSTEVVTVTSSNISGYDKTKTGSQNITVTYEGQTATFTVTVRVAPPANTYVITGSGTMFTATRNNDTIGTANKPIQDVIDGIKTHANGQAAAIYFGDGTALDIGTASVSFNNTSGTWGTITISGKITSSNATSTISIVNVAISVSSSADITNTLTGNTTEGTGDAVRNDGGLTITGGTVQAAQIAVRNGDKYSGTLTISGGTVKTNGNNYAAVQNNNSTVNISNGTVSASGTGRAISNNNAGTVNITGGTVSASGAGAAVYNTDANGNINISGGTVRSTSTAGGYAVDNGAGKVTVSGTANVTSTSNSGTISLRNVSGAGLRLEIRSGTVENTNSGTTASSARTINNLGNGTVTISGGTVSATSGRAVDNASTGTITISNGTVSATSGRAVNNGSTGAIIISGGTVSAGEGVAVYNFSTGTITVSETTTTTKITSRNTKNDEGTITIANGDTTNTNVRLTISGGSVDNTLSIPGSTGGYSIYNASGITSMVNITGGTIGNKKYGTP